MSKTLTLEEAAQQLGLTTEQFKVNLKTHKDFKAVRPLMGGATMHFRAQDIEELGRRLGLGSDPELQLGDSSSDPIIPLNPEEDDDQIEIGRDIVRGPGSSGTRLSGKSSKKLKSSPVAPPTTPDAMNLDSSDEFIPLSEEGGSGRKSGSKKSGSGVKKSGDSSVRLKKQSDSDMRLQTREQNARTEENIELEDQSGKGKPKKTDEVFGVAPEGRSSKKIKKPVDGSDFELKLDADSDSEFELTIADEGSDEADIGVMPKDATAKGGKSGVRLSAPADSGISLEKDSDSEFELNLDARSSQRLAAGPRSSKAKKQEDSDSEFELTLDDSSSEIKAKPSSAKAKGKGKADADKDIFETDFDIPALDDESASEAVVLEEGDTDLESSDFDLALDESGVEESASEVVELEEELDEDGATDDDDESASEALADVDEEESPATVSAGPARPARWGPLPALVLMPCLLVMVLVALMGYETVHGMWGYRQPTKTTSPITRFVAGMFTSDNEMPKE